MFGAKGDGTTDDTAAFNTMFSSMASHGGGVAACGAKTYKFTGTLTIANSGISIMGLGIEATKFLFANGTNDCILLQGGSQIEGITISGLHIVSSSKTGGNAINAQVVALLTLRDLLIDSPFNGILCFQTNTVLEENVTINLPTGVYAHKWDSPTTNNSSDLTLIQCTFQGGYLGADGFVWDGWTTTLRMFGCAILSFHVPFHILNSRASTSAFPSFANIFDLEIDGASAIALLIEAGFNFKFVGCDITNTSGATGQGNADTICVSINPDTGASNTTLVQFVECQIGNCRDQGMFINVRDVSVIGCVVHDVSKSGVNAFSAIEIGPLAQNVTITGGRAGVIFGDGANVGHGILIDSGATKIGVTGVDVTQTNLSGVNNLSSSDRTVVISNCPGYVTESSGFSVISSGNTTITFAHGLTNTSGITIIATPTSPLSTGTTTFISISGTNATITLSASQSGDVGFYWSAQTQTVF
jgi:hypothetical protein